MVATQPAGAEPLLWAFWWQACEVLHSQNTKTKRLRSKSGSKILLVMNRAQPRPHRGPSQPEVRCALWSEAGVMSQQ